MASAALGPPPGHRGDRLPSAARRHRQSRGPYAGAPTASSATPTTSSGNDQLEEPAAELVAEQHAGECAVPKRIEEVPLEVERPQASGHGPDLPAVLGPERGRPRHQGARAASTDTDAITLLPGDEAAGKVPAQRLREVARRRASRRVAKKQPLAPTMVPRRVSSARIHISYPTYPDSP